MNVDERGVSPVVGTILLIAITVILAGTIGFFAMQQGTPEAAPNVALSVEDGNLYHNGGDSIPTSELNVTVGGSDESFDDVGSSFEAGETEALDSTGNITVVHNPTDSVLFRGEVD